MRTVLKKRNYVGLMLAMLLIWGLAPAVADDAGADNLELLRKTSEAFSSVATKAVPAVMFIKVERTIETGAVTGPGAPLGFNDPFGFFGDEFYDRFFRGRQPSQPQEYEETGSALKLWFRWKTP